jgi:hypothetical protein
MHIDILVRTPEGKRPTGRARCGWEENIETWNITLKKCGMKVWTKSVEVIGFIN